MGSAAPNELRDTRRSFVDGEAERWWKNWVESASGDRRAGTSMVLWEPGDSGMVRSWPRPAQLTFLPWPRLLSGLVPAVLVLSVFLWWMGKSLGWVVFSGESGGVCMLLWCFGGAPKSTSLNPGFDMMTER